MDNVTLGVAFLAGLLSFVSPCVLPLVPGYISFLSGMSMEELRGGASGRKVTISAGLKAISFVAGFSIVFIALGASASFVGKLLSQHLAVLAKVAGVLIIVLGVHLLGILKIPWLNFQKGVQVKSSSGGYFGAFVIGLAFAFGWSPCVGPILAGILAMAATQKTMLRGMLLLGMYSAGLGIPFIVTGFAIGLFMRFFEKYKKFIRYGEVVAGIFLVVIGVLIFSNNMSVILKFIPAEFYEFAK